uniref:GDP-mannose 4,6-dehydratase n=1 Tax=Mantoniella tinhauana virus 1 TaxID=3111543 RepID=A0AB38ZMN7_9VIRU
MKMYAAIITGATGQDGSYLCELLHDKGYDIKCLVRDGSRTPVHGTVYEGDVTDYTIVEKMIRDCEGYNRVEIYNLAAQSHVHTSFAHSNLTFETNTKGILNILECVRTSPHPKKYRIYQASSSEMFGKVVETPQNESTPFYPRSVYGVSKVAAHWLVKNYRESYGLYACSGILYNHESPRRRGNFVTKKIVDGVRRIIGGDTRYIELGNLHARRDWGHAKDYVRAMWLTLQQDEPDEYVVATGITHSVKDFVDMCFAEVGKTIVWDGDMGYMDGGLVVKVSPEFYRPCEVDAVVGDASKIKGIGWVQEFTIQDVVKEMMSNP